MLCIQIDQGQLRSFGNPFVTPNLNSSINSAYQKTYEATCYIPEVRFVFNDMFAGY